MSNIPYARAAMAQAALERLPSTIHNTLLEEKEFRDKYGFETDLAIALKDSGVSIQRSVLFNAIREILSGVTEGRLTDTNGREWTIKNAAEDGDLPTLVISVDEQRLDLPDFAALSPESAIRLRSLNEVASNVNLPAKAQDTWSNVLSERALDDEEIDPFHSEFHDTPIHVAYSIGSEIKGGQSSITSLVPNSHRYYERLVGGYDESTSIKDYAAGTGRKFIGQLFK